MPEGDTIWRAAAELRRRAGGRQLVAARPDGLRTLVGRTLESVEPIGKHLYMLFSGGVALHTHLRMTGSWHVYTRAQRRRRAAHLTTAELDFGDVRAVLFAAPTCEVIATSAMGRGLGPDILAAGFDVVDVVARARARGDSTIAEVLLDQSVCAGVGNIFRCEALWHQRIAPTAPLTDLDDATVAALYLRARDLMRRAAIADGFRARHAVHGRAGRPCSACGTLISARSLGTPARIVYWCPSCQPSFGSGRAAAARQAAGSTH